MTPTQALEEADLQDPLLELGRLADDGNPHFPDDLNHPSSEEE
jgi:hypothetical protein